MQVAEAHEIVPRRPTGWTRVQSARLVSALVVSLAFVYPGRIKGIQCKPLVWVVGHEGRGSLGKSAHEHSQATLR